MVEGPPGVGRSGRVCQQDAKQYQAIPRHKQRWIDVDDVETRLHCDNGPGFLHEALIRMCCMMGTGMWITGFCQGGQWDLGFVTSQSNGFSVSLKGGSLV